MAVSHTRIGEEAGDVFCFFDRECWRIIMSAETHVKRLELAAGLLAEGAQDVEAGGVGVTEVKSRKIGGKTGQERDDSAIRVARL